MPITEFENTPATAVSKIEDEGFYDRFLPLATELGQIAISVLKNNQDINDCIQDALEYIIVKSREADVEGKQFETNSRFRSKAVAHILRINSTGIRGDIELTEEVLELFPNTVAPARLDEPPQEPAELDTLEHEIKKLLSTLNPRYQDIIKKIHGLDGEPVMEISEIAETYAISESRVHQIKDIIVAKLRKPQNMRKLANFR